MAEGLTSKVKKVEICRPHGHMHMAYAYGICICHMHMAYAYAICICHMHMPYAYGICICHMHMPYAYAVNYNEFSRARAPPRSAVLPDHKMDEIQGTRSTPWEPLHRKLCLGNKTILKLRIEISKLSFEISNSSFEIYLPPLTLTRFMRTRLQTKQTNPHLHNTRETEIMKLQLWSSNPKLPHARNLELWLLRMYI